MIHHQMFFVAQAQGFVAEWINVVGAITTADSIERVSSGAIWESGGMFNQPIIADGYIEFVHDSGRFMAGLAGLNSVANYSSISHAIFFNNSNFQVFENGTNKGVYGTILAGDKLRVQRTGSTVEYKKNGVVLYTSLLPSNGNVFFDCSLRDTGAKIKEIEIGE